MTIEDPGAPPADNGEFWLFGYGSLIWKPPPHFDRRIPGWVTGYVRRFWQGSQDHRGTPEAPGRVVTLIERSFWETLPDPHSSSPEKVWGVAYRIESEHVEEVKEYLDIREINGYTIVSQHYTPFYPASNPQNPIRTLAYIGTPENDQFVGPQDLQALAEHIYRSEGPSGLNRDYLLGLEKALKELSPDSGDEHVTDLSNRVRLILAREEGKTPVAGDGGAVDRVVSQESNESATAAHGFRKVSSVDEQEETEKAL
ncbi:Putative glutathione-specific gamma-glutamylcyclotransferase 2 [Cytospora mali]|uniref:glutathione-specific gamma-glutamylcyclotransferase n=1 Tax=Cytospora mali TaxID=578113 RepID=A0A194VBM7_CYTMA|nr:Putative glutathione-specific gamma-glutamylcyclotransferase 2 [Valsa mali var. pyri (nom. inval.)]